MTCTNKVNCICGGSGDVERGPAGATHGYPCPGPPEEIVKYGVKYIRDRRRCTCLAGKGTNPGCQVCV